MFLKQIEPVLKDEFIGLVSHELPHTSYRNPGSSQHRITEGDRLSTKQTKQLVGDAYSEAELLSEILRIFWNWRGLRLTVCKIMKSQSISVEIIENTVKKNETADIFTSPFPSTVMTRLQLMPTVSGCSVFCITCWIMPLNIPHRALKLKYLPGGTRANFLSVFRG